MEIKARLTIGVVLFLLVFKGYGQSTPIRYLNKPLIGERVTQTNEFIRTWEDSTFSDLIYQHLSDDNIPVYYSREIKTSVCFDGKCRLLDIILYWNPVGGYHGFELPQGEFLSKTDHDPFTEEEYKSLHEILSDSLSPLADYSFDEIVPGTGNPHEVDAVSSATLKEILDHIVPGAAYTTYRLWHLIYGESSREISRLSEQMFAEKFANLLLHSDQVTAQIWALRRLSLVEKWSNEIVNSVLNLLEHDHLNVTVEAILSLDAQALEKKEVQEKLAEKIGGKEYSLKKLAIQKLKEAPHIEKTVEDALVDLVVGLNGDLLGELLSLFIEKDITDPETQRRVSEVLEGNNRYISGKAMDYLKQVSPTDPLVLARMNAYTNQN